MSPSTPWQCERASGDHPLTSDLELPPRAAHGPTQIWQGDDDIPHEPATIEGGDILVIGNSAIMVGLSERTTAQGISKLAHSLFSDPANAVTTIIVADLPRQRAFMHLDTAMTMVDRDAFSVYPYLDRDLRSWTLEKGRRRRWVPAHRKPVLFPAVRDALGVDELRVLKHPST